MRHWKEGERWLSCAMIDLYNLMAYERLYAFGLSWSAWRR
jgi:hypothetical protein